MRALTRKLLRDVLDHRGQMLSIAAVVATGIMTVLTMRGTYESLVLARDQYYAAVRFPDVWVKVERAPESVVRRLREIPGVVAVDTRVVLAATLDVPGLDVPAQAQFISIPSRHRPVLGDVHLKAGRYISPSRGDDVLISKNFAAANTLDPGDRFRAVINGRLRDLTVAGIAISAENSYVVPPGSLFPNDRQFGIVWMSREVLGPAFDMDGSFNEAVFALSPRANLDHVLAAIDRILEPYGGLGAYARPDQPSHQIMEGELEQNRTMGTVIPIVFLTVAAFLLNIVLGRLIDTQRTSIAVLKAFGYRSAEIGRHYLGFGLAAVLAGLVPGTLLGVAAGAQMVRMYGTYFDFPTLTYVVSWPLAGLAAGISLAAAALGALGAVRRAARLPPAEAMRAEPPASFRPGLLERLGVTRALPAAGQMILRNIERRPSRSLLSGVGVAFSVAILVMGMFMFDGVEYMMDLQFRVAQREDLALTFGNPISRDVRYDLAHLEGVTRVEPYRTVPVRLWSGHRERETAITGLEPGTRLRRIVSADGGIQPLPHRGVVISAALATQLGTRPGEMIEVEVLEGARRRAAVMVTGVVDDFLGLSAYMPIDLLHALVGGARAYSGAYLEVRDEARSALNARLKQVPVVASVSSPTQVLESFRKQLSESLFVAVLFFLVFSCVISVAVIYNGARIALSERGRELASLRVLGFSRGEVAVLLLGEQAIVTLVAIPVGCALGYGLSAAVVAGLATDAYRIPLVISVQTYLWAALTTLVATGLSGWIVRRRLDRLDMVSVLKTRE